MSVNFEYYKIFYYVAKYQNFTIAAKALLSSQPSVSRCMQALESELGCRLFVRSKRGVSLTAEGEQLFQYVAPACEQIFKGEENIGGTLGLQKGSVYIGVTETALHCFLLERLADFHREYPGVRIKLTNATTPNTLGDLKAGKTDLAVVTTPIRDEEYFRVTTVKKSHDILVGGSNYAQLKDKRVSLREVLQYPFVSLAENTMTYALYKEFFARKGLVLKPDIELATADLMLPVIRHGLGIGFVPRELAEEALKNGEVVEIRIEEPIAERSICLVENTQKPLSLAARQLIRMLKKTEQTAEERN
jgi:DNA-binding transcriptional LysR family regulator